MGTEAIVGRILDLEQVQPGFWSVLQHVLSCESGKDTDFLAPVFLIQELEMIMISTLWDTQNDKYVFEEFVMVP